MALFFSPFCFHRPIYLNGRQPVDRQGCSFSFLFCNFRSLEVGGVAMPVFRLDLNSLVLNLIRGYEVLLDPITILFQCHKHSHRSPSSREFSPSPHRIVINFVIHRNPLPHHSVWTDLSTKFFCPSSSRISELPYRTYRLAVPEGCPPPARVKHRMPMGCRWGTGGFTGMEK